MLEVGGNAVSIAAGDLDGDGDNDIVAANGFDNTISVLLAKGNATFSPPMTYASSMFPMSVVLGDFDGDGDLDIAAANQNNDKISVFRNDGDGTFLPQVQYGAGGPLPHRWQRPTSMVTAISTSSWASGTSLPSC